MKENKEKEVVGEENRPETHAQTRPSAGEKRKPLSKHLDIGNLPSRRDGLQGWTRRGFC